MASFDKKSQSWRARWQINGVRKSKSGFTSKKNAEIYEREQRINYERGLLGFPVKKEIKIEEIFDKYLDWGEKSKTQKTSSRDKSALKIWRHFFEDYNISLVEQVNNELINQSFIKWRSVRRTSRGTYPKKRTINLDLITIKSVFAWAAKVGILNDSPIKTILVFSLEHPGTPRYLEKHEIELVESRAFRELRLAISVLVRTGMRSGELCNLRCKNIDFKNSLIILTASSTKGKRERRIPMCKKVKSIIEDLTEEAIQKKRDYLFCTSTGTIQTPANLNRRFRCLLKTLQKEGLIEDQHKIKIHTLRATFISHKMMVSEDPQRVMAIVGHQEWSTVKRYLALHPDYISGGKELPY